MTDAALAATVQLTFTVEEQAAARAGRLYRAVAALDHTAIADVLGLPDAASAGHALIAGAADYQRLVAEAAGHLRHDAHISGTTLLVCTTAETFRVDPLEVTAGPDIGPAALAALSADVAHSRIGDVTALVMLAEQLPELAAAAGLVCRGMPSLETVLAHARDPALASP